jgi:predicted component of viral defense system (DUF524 family)
VPRVTDTLLELKGRHAAAATLLIQLLPNVDPDSEPPPLLVRDAADPDDGLEAVQLLEGHEYRYVVQDVAREPILLEPSEVFAQDDASGKTGRLRPRLATGRIEVALREGTTTLGIGALEVRSRKLGYLDHYRWMLRDIADMAAEVIMERFAISEQRFAFDETRDARTLYQQFEFLQSLLSGSEFEAAIRQILTRPYVAWEELEELRPPSRRVPGSSDVARQVAKAGRRLPWPKNALGIPTLPALFRVHRTETSVDNIPNRFVKFALTRWRDVVLLIERALEKEQVVQPVQRGLREVRAVADRLDVLVNEELFRSIGDLWTFPAGNQVLQKREGYRDVFKTHIQFEIASKLAWAGGEDVYGAGQRNVAALYEFWVFLQLAAVFSQLCDMPLDLEQLIEMDADGLGISLRRGASSRLRGSVHRLGRTFHLELWFNKTFGTRAGPESGAWTRPMRPDASLFIDADNAPTFDPIWLHFDAKYRIEALAEAIPMLPLDEVSETTLIDEQAAAEDAGSAKYVDLLKMHSYRDAIRRSAGAYVLYPGSQDETCFSYHEILPGLGAFGLRPTDTGAADGTRSISDFAEDVLDHVASQLTQHERERFWRRESHQGEPTRARTKAAPFLRQPPADTTVLLGYVRSPAHLEWIRREHLYNIRADDRSGAVSATSEALAAELILLYGTEAASELWTVAGAPAVHTETEMRGLAYPNPRGRLYFCFPLGLELQLSLSLSNDDVEALRELREPSIPFGAPLAVSWIEIAQAAAHPLGHE